MSSNRTPLVLMIAAGLLLAGLFYYFYTISNRDRYDWRDAWPKKAYAETDKEPYGTQMAHRLLADYFPGKKQVDITRKISSELPSDSAQHYNYVFVGEGMFLDSLDTERLLDFVRAGNTAFISSKCVPFDLMFHVYYDQCGDNEWDEYEEYSDSLVRLSLPQPSAGKIEAQVHFAQKNRPIRYDWHHIPAKYFCGELPHRPIGHLNDSLINFAQFRYGKGQFLLHTNPVVFSNYSLLRPSTRPYVEGLLAWLPEGQVYWDALSRVPEVVARRANANSRGLPSRSLADEHPLTYILQQPALAWGWYILMGLTGLWFVFRAKRRQRIIPVLRKNENSSYEFINTIANLHFRERNYDGICLQSMKLFLAQIRERYGLAAVVNPVTHEARTDDDYFRRLSAVSEVPESALRDIFTQYAACVQYQTNEEMMVNLHLATEAFWKKAK